ncbi:hypothetical protein JTB14_019011 [Gonioctena quinquepunctata]|nr:hypothetical protein JTB14_019011 [Gonioctena quinquepunctata]
MQARCLTGRMLRAFEDVGDILRVRFFENVQLLWEIADCRELIVGMSPGNVEREVMKNPCYFRIISMPCGGERILNGSLNKFAAPPETVGVGGNRWKTAGTFHQNGFSCGI